MRSIITVLLVLVTTLSYADVVDKKMQVVLQELSEAYVKKNPVGTVKRGLAVLNFSENSEKAKKAGIGTTIRENLSRKVISSNIFYLVDRDTLQKSISEIEMSQSGLIDDKSISKAGKIAGVQVFITGSVSDIGNEFVVNFKVIDVETATVVAMTETRIPQDELIEVREKYAYEYIAQYGLGINVQFSYIPKIKCPIDGYTSYMLDTFLNYRPMLWLNFKLGVSYYALEFNKIGNIPSAIIFPTITIAPNYNNPPAPGEPFMNVPIIWQKSKIDFISPYIGLDYNYTPSYWFTIGFGFGLNLVKNIEYVQQYDKGFKDRFPETTHV